MNPLIQLKMYRIRGFRTVLEKIDTATGESFMYGNERLVSGWSMTRLFRDVGIVGASRLFRLVPTALAMNQTTVRLAKQIERRNLDALFAPACIHCVYRGQRPD